MYFYLILIRKVYLVYCKLTGNCLCCRLQKSGLLVQNIIEVRFERCMCVCTCVCVHMCVCVCACACVCAHISKAAIFSLTSGCVIPTPRVLLPTPNHIIAIKMLANKVLVMSRASTVHEFLRPEMSISPLSWSKGRTSSTHVHTSVNFLELPSPLMA